MAGNSGTKGEKKSKAEMIGEGLRDCGILVVVFGFLDPMVQHETPSVGWTVVILSTMLGLFGVGMAIERIRKP